MIFFIVFTEIIVQLVFQNYFLDTPCQVSWTYLMNTTNTKVWLKYFIVKHAVNDLPLKDNGPLKAILLPGNSCI